MDVAGYGAVGILGPGADGLARAAVVGLLAAGGPAAVEVLLVGNQLIPGAIGFPGLRRAASLAGALHVVEAELVHRARLLEAEDAPDFASHRREHPDDPLPALVLVADGVSLEQAGRLAAILAQGPRLGVGALLPGTTVEAGAQLVLDDSGRVQAATPWELGDQQLIGVRACSLTEAEAAELLGVLAQSRTDDPEPSDPGPPDAAADAGDPRRPHPTARLTLRDAVDALAGLAADRASAEALVQVQLLGPFTIQTATGELRSGLRASARELLAYYLVHPGGASLEQAVEAMWPDTEPGRERERFWTALGNLRDRAAQGDRRRPAESHPARRAPLPRRSRRVRGRPVAVRDRPGRRPTGRARPGRGRRAGRGRRGLRRHAGGRRSLRLGGGAAGGCTTSGGRRAGPPGRAARDGRGAGGGVGGVGAGDQR